MNGMVLAAGRGERMEPLSSWVAKPALDVLGEPLLGSAFRLLRAAGCDPLVVNLHRHPVQVAAAARSCEPAFRGLRFSWEDRLAGGGGGLTVARRCFGSGPVLVANADAALDLDIGPLLVDQDPTTASLALLPHPDPDRWSSVVLDDDGLVAAILPRGADRDRSGHLFTGVQVLGERVVANLPAPPAPMDAAWEPLLRSRRLRGVVVSGRFREAGNPAEYRELVVARVAGSAWIHDTAAVAEDATLEATAVSAGCRVATGCRLRGTVVTAGATVLEGCELDGCVVAGPVALDAGSRLGGRLVLPSGDWPL